MNEEEHFLQSRPVKTRRPPNFLQKIRLRWARMVKLFASHSRHKRSSVRLALFMRKRTFKGEVTCSGSFEKNHASCFPPFPPLKRFRFRAPKWRRKNTPLFTRHAHHPICDDDHLTNDLAFLPLQNHQDCVVDDDDDDGIKLCFGHRKEINRANAPLQYQQFWEQSNDDGLVCQSSRHHEEKNHSNHDGLKVHIREWRRRADRALAKRVNKPLASSSHNKGKIPRDVPKGYVGVYVGVEHRRFVVPVRHLNHPIFGHLLNSMHDQYELPQPGPLFIPCEVSEFESLHSQIKHLSKIKGSHANTSFKLTQLHLFKHSSESRIGLLSAQ